MSKSQRLWAQTKRTPSKKKKVTQWLLTSNQYKKNMLPSKTKPSLPTNMIVQRLNNTNKSRFRMRIKSNTLRKTITQWQSNKTKTNPLDKTQFSILTKITQRPRFQNKIKLQTQINCPLKSNNCQKLIRSTLSSTTLRTLSS